MNKIENYRIKKLTLRFRMKDIDGEVGTFFSLIREEPKEKKISVKPGML